MATDTYFKRTSFIHGLFSLSLLAIFGVGFTHTQNTDWDGTAPYWVFGAIGGFLHLVGICFAVNCHKKRNTHRLISALGLYRLFCFLLFVYCFVGTVSTGTTGVCANLDECPYKENQGLNKGMAITQLVLHIISFLFAVWVHADVGTQYRSTTSTTTPAPKTPALQLARSNSPEPNVRLTLTRNTDPPRNTEPPRYTEPPRRNAEPPAYNIPLPPTYNILPAPGDTLPPPPSYDSIMYCENPELGLEPTAPAVAQPRSTEAQSRLQPRSTEAQPRPQGRLTPLKKLSRKVTL